MASFGWCRIDCEQARKKTKRTKTFNFSTDCVMHQTEYKFQAAQIERVAHICDADLMH